MKIKWLLIVLCSIILHHFNASAKIISFQDVLGEESRTEISGLGVQRLGPGAGGGGHSCEFIINQLVKDLYNYAQFIPFFTQNKELLTKFKESIKYSKIEFKPELLLLDEKSGEYLEKDMINFPFDFRIQVSEKYCSKIEYSSKHLSLFAHEYLGLTKIDDVKFQYQHSGVILQEFTAIGLPLFKPNLNVEIVPFSFVGAYGLATNGSGNVVIITRDQGVFKIVKTTEIKYSDSIRLRLCGKVLAIINSEAVDDAFSTENLLVVYFLEHGGVLGFYDVGLNNYRLFQDITKYIVMGAPTDRLSVEYDFVKANSTLTVSIDMYYSSAGSENDGDGELSKNLTLIYKIKNKDNGIILFLDKTIETQ